jgi:hypothetical protein
MRAHCLVPIAVRPPRRGGGARSRRRRRLAAVVIQLPEYLSHPIERLAHPL